MKNDKPTEMQIFMKGGKTIKIPFGEEILELRPLVLEEIDDLFSLHEEVRINLMRDIPGYAFNYEEFKRIYDKGEKNWTPEEREKIEKRLTETTLSKLRTMNNPEFRQRKFEIINRSLGKELGWIQKQLLQNPEEVITQLFDKIIEINEVEKYVPFFVTPKM